MYDYYIMHMTALDIDNINVTLHEYCLSVIPSMLEPSIAVIWCCYIKLNAARTKSKSALSSASSFSIKQALTLEKNFYTRFRSGE